MASPAFQSDAATISSDIEQMRPNFDEEFGDDDGEAEAKSESEVNETSIPPPPTDQVFDSSDEAVAFVKQFAMAHGYAVSIRSTNKKKGIVRYIYIECDRGRKKPNKKHRGIRNTGGYRQDCPFKVMINYLHGSYAIRVMNPSHNHGLSVCVSSHPSHRRAYLADKKPQIISMLKSGLSVSQIMDSLLGEDARSPLKKKDIYNLQYQLIKKL